MNFLIMLISAFGIGALHALEPGHGKSIMGAYLILSRGRAIHAVVLGLTSAITHTTVIVVMSLAAHGVIGAAANQTGLADNQTVELWLKAVSGLLITLIGLRMALRRTSGCSCGCNGRHVHHRPAVGNTGEWLSLIGLGVTSGMLICPSALAIMLMSISTNAIASGIVLVIAFGIGGAVSLIAVGLILLKLSKGASNIISHSGWSRLANLSGVLITAIGFFTCYGAVKSLWGA
ncbi:sulfite exporter TauE/SafE family protein [Peptococcaceae bacterium 1198_IL3148]